MDNIKITKINLTDIDQLQVIGRQTFFEAFSGGNTEENIQKYLEEGFTVDKLTSELTNPNSSFFFAKLDNIIIGYLKINFGQAQTELNDHKSLEIERIYVLQAFHGKNVGQLLYEKALEIARKANIDYIWLGVWEENPKAIRFYQKNGFVPFDKHIFILGEDEQTDILMKLNLTPNDSQG